MTQLDKLGQEIFEMRYASPGEKDWKDRAKVIAKTIASIEDDIIRESVESNFYFTLKNLDFLPGGRINYGSGRNIGKGGHNLLNCFNLTPFDSVESIGRTIQDMYRISCAGGGVGFNFSRIRPRGDDIQNVKNSAPGSVSVMRMINEIANHVRAGKNRRSALMAMLNDNHPDLLEFLDAKLNKGELNNFNISVAITNRFVEAVENDEPWYFFFGNKRYHVYEMDRISELGNDKLKVVALSAQDAIERAKQHSKKHFNDTFTNSVEVDFRAKHIWDLIYKNSIECGDPGIFNLDLANEHTNVSYFSKLVVTNPCVAKGTYVNTPFGFVKVEDLRVGDLINTVKGSEPIKSIETHLDYPTVKIKFSDGGEQIVTSAHRYHVFGGKYGKIETKRVDELSVGDYVRVKVPEVKEVLDDNKYLFGLKQGILLGDASIVNCPIKIASNQDDKDYNNKIKSLFGDSNFIKDDVSKNSKSMSLVLSQDSSKIILEELNLEKNYSEDKNIPMSTINDYSKALGVIDGLLATDGNILIKSQTPQARITTCSKEMALSIRRACMTLGIHARIYDSFHDDGGHINGRKITRKNIRYDVHIMADGLMKLSQISKLYLLHKDKGAKLSSIIKDYCLLSGTYRAKIESIEPHVNCDVFDLYCEESDTWITDGYVQQGCGEIPLEEKPLGGGNCCLGHINLSNMVSNGEVDWKKLARTVRQGVRFLDNVIDVNSYPTPECREVAQETRRIGLGFTGLAYMLIKLNLRYGSEKSLEFIERLMATIRDEAYKESVALAKEKGPFPMFEAKKFLAQGFAKTLPSRIRSMIREHGIRNAVMLTVAPTGTISLMAGISSGIEPIFSAIYKRRYRQANVWKETIVVDPLLKEFYSSGKPMHEWYHNFAGAYDVTPEEHIRVQAAVQKYVDQSVSKTINLPSTYTWEDLSKIALKYAYDLKGLTVYRASSKENEPLEAIPLTDENIKKYLAISTETEIVDGAVCKANGECG